MYIQQTAITDTHHVVRTSEDNRSIHCCATQHKHIPTLLLHYFGAIDIHNARRHDVHMYVHVLADGAQGRAPGQTVTVEPMTPQTYKGYSSKPRMINETYRDLPLRNTLRTHVTSRLFRCFVRALARSNILLGVQHE